MRNLALLALALLVFPYMLLAQACAPETQQAQKEPDMITEINSSTKLAYEGGTLPLTTTPVVGTPNRKYNSTFKPGTEQLDADEIRVTILGSGDPFVKKGQASPSVLIEVGNEQQDFFFFDLGSGSLANFNGLRLPSGNNRSGRLAYHGQDQYIRPTFGKTI